MDLKELLKDIDVIEISGPGQGEVGSVCYDSRKCTAGSLFVAVAGFKSDGHDFIDAAVRAGAAFVVHEKDVNVAPHVTAVKVRNSRRALGLLGRNFFRNPSADLCLVGVTGTNGKTTITFLLESIWKAAGAVPGVIGTINYRYGDRVLAAPNTTPESFELQRILREMADSGVTHVVMEVSSHALDLGRVDDCLFRAGIFTNLTQDHLDYHKTMEDYFQAKRKLFDMLEKSGAPAILNADDPWSERLERGMKGPVLTYGIDCNAEVAAFQPRVSVRGIDFFLKIPDGISEAHSPLIGRFNLYNVLAAAAAAYALGIPPDAILEGIERLEKIPGRMEKVSLAGEPTVFVDYAHTEDALRRALQNITSFKERNVITVFGCGGDRDRGKRPLMGKAAVSFSDLAILTSDNPRSEEPEAIIAEIERGIDGSCRKYHPDEFGPGGLPPRMEKGYLVVPDRRAAIRTAIALADPADIVLIAGKGHENYQIVKNRTTTFDDRVVSREVLDDLKKERAS